MTYELAKELKDAGFPQTGKGEYIGVSGGLIEHSGDVYLPTLSELIEACDGNLRFLEHMDNDEHGEWMARGKNYEHGWGAKPEEAAARLWLTLKK